MIIFGYVNVTRLDERDGSFSIDVVIKNHVKFMCIKDIRTFTEEILTPVKYLDETDIALQLKSVLVLKCVKTPNPGRIVEAN